MTKKDLKTGMMVETRNGEKYIVINNKLSSVDGGHMNLKDYDDKLFLFHLLTGVYGNNDYDIIKIYNANEFGNYECIWNRDPINKKEYVIDMEDSDGYEWRITISPNNENGYREAISESETPFIIKSEYEDGCIYLTKDGAKQLIAALQEVLDYLEKEKNK